MPKCILHVGMHKTGTTSLQNSLQDLADSDFCYARLLGNPNHSKSLYNTFASAPEMLRANRRMARSETAIEQGAALARRDLKASIEAANGRTLVLSGEMVLLLSAADLNKFKRFMARNGYGDIEIIGYVRPPAAYLSSAIQQRIKNGKFNSFHIEAVAPSYRRLFVKFDRVFGGGNVRLFRFDPTAFAANDVVLDFCARTGIPAASINLIRRNESISRLLAQLLYQYGRHAVAEGLPAIRGVSSRRLCGALAGLDDTRFRLSPELVRPILAANRAAIQWMERRLGQPLGEDLGEELDLDIRSEDDLLAPVAGINERLAEVLLKAGAGVTAQDAGSTWAMLHRIAEFGAPHDVGAKTGAMADTGVAPDKMSQEYPVNAD